MTKPCNPNPGLRLRSPSSPCPTPGLDNGRWRFVNSRSGPELVKDVSQLQFSDRLSDPLRLVNLGPQTKETRYKARISDLAWNSHRHGRPRRQAPQAARVGADIALFVRISRTLSTEYSVGVSAKPFAGWFASRPISICPIGSSRFHVGAMRIDAECKRLVSISRRT